MACIGAQLKQLTASRVSWPSSLPVAPVSMAQADPLPVHCVRYPAAPAGMVACGAPLASHLPSSACCIALRCHCCNPAAAWTRPHLLSPLPSPPRPPCCCPPPPPPRLLHFPRGVFWDKKTKRWRCQLGYQSKKIFLGYYEDPADAARAYDQKLVELRGAAGEGRGVGGWVCTGVTGCLRVCIGRGCGRNGDTPARLCRWVGGGRACEQHASKGEQPGCIAGLPALCHTLDPPPSLPLPPLCSPHHFNCHHSVINTC